MNVRGIAEQVVAALPDGVDFSDLDKFLYERSLVEKGREEFERGKVLSNDDALGRRKAATPGPPWAEHAAAALREALEAAQKDGVTGESALREAVRHAAKRLADGAEEGISLPEMGDATIREVHVQPARIRYRIIFDAPDGVARVLCFTNNTACYRNCWPLSRRDDTDSDLAAAPHNDGLRAVSGSRSARAQVREG